MDLDYKVLWLGLRNTLDQFISHEVRSLHPYVVLRFMNGAEQAAQDAVKAAKAMLSVEAEEGK